MKKCPTGNESQGHGYFSAGKFLVLGPVVLVSSFRLIACGVLIISALIIPQITHAYTSPGKPQGFVSDFASVLSPSAKIDLESRLTSLQKSTGDQVAVVTINSLGNETVESYAVNLFKEWGIGNDKNDNGLLILVAIEDRAVRIEVGYGLEGTVTDLQSGNIIRNVMTPAFKDGDYDTGISGAVNAVEQIITNSPDAAQYSEPQKNQFFKEGDINFGSIIFFVLILLNVLTRVLGSTKSWWFGGVLGAGAGSVIGFIWGFMPIGIVSIVCLTVFGLIFDYIVSKNPPGSGGSGGIWPIFFGGGRGGSSGGGFGGFGGGSSGGGGASGRW